MCGRSACSLSKQSIIEANVYKCAKTNQLLTPEWIPLNGKQLDSYKQNFNQSPGQSLPVLLLKKQIDKNCDNNKELRIISEMRWGLVPDWHKSDINQFKFKTINCRLESIKEKKTYSVPLLKGKRCVVLVEGFFNIKKLITNHFIFYFF
jgi:putative SOS response-associated peptidase YedK